MRRHRAEPAIPALRRNRRILFRSHKAYVVEVKRLQINRFLNQVAVFLADVLELGRRHTHVERTPRGMAKPRRLEPGFE